MTLAIAAAVAVVVLAAGCGLVSADGEESAAEGQRREERPVAVRVVSPEYRRLEQRMSYVGTVYAGREVQVISRVQGTVAEQSYAEGERFEQGELLARLDSPEMEAAVARAEAERDYWCRKHEADERLAERGALPAEEAAASDRACRSAKAGLDEVQAQLDKTRVEAPFAGEILDRLAEPGQPLMPGQPVVLIGNSGREVRVDVVEEDLERGVTVGTEASMRLDAERLVESTVTRVSPVSAGPARAFEVTVPIPAGADEQPRKGASIRVDFILDRAERSLSVPSRAVAAEREGQAVYVIRDGNAHRRPVETGVTEGGWTAVELDYDGESPVAVTNIRSLQDGRAVYAVAEEASR